MRVEVSSQSWGYGTIRAWERVYVATMRDLPTESERSLVVLAAPREPPSAPCTAAAAASSSHSASLSPAPSSVHTTPSLTAAAAAAATAALAAAVTAAVATEKLSHPPARSLLTRRA